MWRILGGFGLLTGATYPFRALAVFYRTPRLWKYIVIPIALNFVLGITVYAGLLSIGWEFLGDLMGNVSNWIDNLIANLPAWLGVVEYLLLGVGFILHLLLVLGLFLLCGFVLMQFGVLLGAPWYGQLSEQIEKLRTGKLEIVEVGIIRDLWRAILFELKKLALIAIVGLPLILLNFFVGLGTAIATIIGIILSATIVCLDFLDAPLERRRLHFREKLAIVLKSLPASASFSLVCLGLISIPFVNLFTIPLCVVSGTLFFCDRIKVGGRSEE